MTATRAGIFFFVASFLAASLVDAPAKLLIAAGLPMQTVVFFRYAIAFAALVVTVAMRPRQLQFTSHWQLSILRGILLTASTFVNFYAVSHLQLAQAASISFAAPLISCALAPFILHEYVGPRRWAAVVVGFLGMLIVMRPGSASFQPAMLFSVGNAFLVAFYQIVTRKAGVVAKPEVALLWVFAVGLVVSSLTLAVPGHWQTPQLVHLPWLLLMGLAGFVTHYLISRALTLAPASTLAPFMYSQIIWMVVLGFILFGDRPDRWTMLGSGLIVASGIYVWHRERLRAQPAEI